jgi:hypothetical protein
MTGKDPWAKFWLAAAAVKLNIEREEIPTQLSHIRLGYRSLSTAFFLNF